jgi:hypothetical protein
MKKFKDTEGREWSLTVNVGSIKAVRDVTGIDLTKLFKDSSQSQALFDDIPVFATVLWTMVEKQARERGVDEDSFGNSLLGDVVEEASDALIAEVINFFPSGRRKIFQATKDKADAAAKLMEAKAMKAIEQMSFEPATKSAA